MTAGAPRLALVLLAAAPAVAQPPAPAFDHHVHLLSPRLVADWKSLGVPFSRPDAAYVAADGLLGGERPLRQVLLLPMAHFYGNDEFRGGLRLSEADERTRVSGENDHVAREARRWPGRAAALCAVDFRRPYAWDELRRCRKQLASPGVKLHLGSARADLRSAETLAALARLAAWAEAERLLLLLHFDPQRPGLERADVERFLATVLAPHPELELLVAHLGGSGGYSAWPRAVLGAFSDWLAVEERAGRPRRSLRLEVSAALLEKESEGVPATSEAEALALGDDLRRLGLARVLFGSDYPVFDPWRQAELLGQRAGLTRDELARLLANRAPLLERLEGPAK